MVFRINSVKIKHPEIEEGRAFNMEVAQNREKIQNSLHSNIYIYIYIYIHTHTHTHTHKRGNTLSKTPTNSYTNNQQDTTV